MRNWSYNYGCIILNIYTNLEKKHLRDSGEAYNKELVESQTGIVGADFP